MDWHQEKPEEYIFPSNKILDKFVLLNVIHSYRSFNNKIEIKVHKEDGKKDNVAWGSGFNRTEQDVAWRTKETILCDNKSLKAK